jgi:hypothetical protein
MADLARVQFLVFGRERQIRVELAFGEEFQGFVGAIFDHVEVSVRRANRIRRLSNMGAMP